jgi:hypothetical protein
MPPSRHSIALHSSIATRPLTQLYTPIQSLNHVDQMMKAVFVRLSDDVDTLEKAYNDIQLVAIDSMPGTLMFSNPQIRKTRL